MRRTHHFLLKSLLQKPVKARYGFTLIELLIVVLIGSIIVTTLLSLVIELASTEQRESARTETQREMQMALDYIAADLREAVYIYDNSENLIESATPKSRPRYWNYILGTSKPSGAIPIIAFWKPRPLDNEQLTRLPAASFPVVRGTPNCSTVFSGGATDPLQVPAVRECNNLWQQRRTYSLVVYMQVPKSGSWKGETHIRRYEMTKYRASLYSGTAFTRTPGFVDPSEIGVGLFETWPFVSSAGTAQNCQQSPGCNNLPAAGAPDTSVSPAVLVDYVDMMNPPNRGPSAPANPSCSSFGNRPDGQPQYLDTAINPGNLTAEPSTSFKVCIRNTRATPTVTDPNPQIPLGQPQDIVVYIRGNAKGRPGISSDSFLPTLQTRITMRGVIDRTVRTN